MAELTRYDLSDGVATITLDDGKVNALSPAMLGELSGRLDQAESDEAIVILTGRERILSAGFDLKTEGDRWPEMLEAGAGR
jgi:enoyl-CoA hydratase